MSSLPLSGKTALVTGGSKGIGRAICTHLHTLGANIAFAYSSDTSAADSLVKELGGPSRCLAVRADVSSVASLTTLVSQTVSTFGQIDILIPNAGILQMRTVANTTESDFDTAFALNVKHPYFLIQAALPHMPTTGSSSIVLVSTTQNTASTVAAPYTLYCSTKGAVEQMTRIMAKDLTASKKIRVNAVAPGPTATDLFFEGKSEEMLKMLRGLNPNGRIGEPDEVAQVVGFLAGAGSSWVNGQIVRVNGGQA